MPKGRKRAKGKRIPTIRLGLGASESLGKSRHAGHTITLSPPERAHLRRNIGVLPKRFRIAGKKGKR